MRAFITGTDTGVGKTRVTAALCHAYGRNGLRVAAMKPIASGCLQTPEGLRNEDALALLRVMNARPPYSDVNPYAFEPAIAPHIAASEAGQSIDLEVLDRCYGRLVLQSDVTLVEGAGGWLAPLDKDLSFADLAVRWRLAVVLVVGLRLGCLNHALLTVESIKRRGLTLLGWVGNSIEPDFARSAENLRTLECRIAAPCIGRLPHAPHATTAEEATLLAERIVELTPSAGA